MAISLSLITHLCMAHVIVGEVSSAMFSAKYWERRLETFCMFSRSINTESSRRKIVDLLRVNGKVKVMVMG